MARRTTRAQLASYERRYHELADELARIGFICAGSITRRTTRCGTAGCRCHGDPPQMHGPYYQWTAKVDGKTVTKRLSEAEAALYEEWIGNDRRMRALVTEMRQIAAKAGEILLEEAAAG